MTTPTREEVEAFIAALNYGMKVSHKPEFLIALAEGWLDSQKPCEDDCDHEWRTEEDYDGEPLFTECIKCGCR